MGSRCILLLTLSWTSVLEAYQSRTALDRIISKENVDSIDELSHLLQERGQGRKGPLVGAGNISPNTTEVLGEKLAGYRPYVVVNDVESVEKTNLARNIFYMKPNTLKPTDKEAEKTSKPDMSPREQIAKGHDYQDLDAASQGKRESDDSRIIFQPTEHQVLLPNSLETTRTTPTVQGTIADVIGLDYQLQPLKIPPNPHELPAQQHTNTNQLPKKSIFDLTVHERLQNNIPVEQNLATNYNNDEMKGQIPVQLQMSQIEPQKAESFDALVHKTALGDENLKKSNGFVPNQVKTGRDRLFEVTADGEMPRSGMDYIDHGHKSKESQIEGYRNVLAVDAVENVEDTSLARHIFHFKPEVMPLKN